MPIFRIFCLKIEFIQKFLRKLGIESLVTLSTVISKDTEINAFHVIEEMMKNYPMEALRKDKFNNTPLSWATKQKHFELVTFMASRNPNPIYAFLTVELEEDKFQKCFKKMMKMNFELTKSERNGPTYDAVF